MAEPVIDPVKVVVTKREETPEHPTLIRTPQSEADLQVVPMPWYTQVLIRAARTYLQNVIGYILGAAIGTSVAYAAEAVLPVMPARDFAVVFLASLSVAIGPTVVCVLQNGLEILTKLDATQYAIWRA